MAILENAFTDIDYLPFSSKGVATLLVVVILTIPQIGLQDVSNILQWIFLAVFPNYCLAQGVFDFYQNYQYLNICKPFYENNVWCSLMKALNETNPCCPGE